jgi:hypothetical protein
MQLIVNGFKRNLMGQSYTISLFLRSILGGSQRQPGVVMQAADDVVKWNKQSVISGVWELYKK